MLTAYKEFWKRYAEFTGQSSRSEYWYAFLANLLIEATLLILGLMFFVSNLSLSTRLSEVDSYETVAEVIGAFFLGLIPFILYRIATFIPRLAISMRRLRDADYHWAFIFLSYGPMLLMVVPGLNLLASALSFPCFIAFMVLLSQPTKQKNDQTNFASNPYAQPQPFGTNNQNFNQQSGQSFGQNDQQFNQQATNQQGQNFNQQPAQPFGQNGQQFNQQATNQQGQNFNQQPAQSFGQNTQNFNQGQNAEPVASQPFPQAQPVGTNPGSDTVQANQSAESIQPTEPVGQGFTQTEENPVTQAEPVNSSPKSETSESLSSEE